VSWSVATYYFHRLVSLLANGGFNVNVDVYCVRIMFCIFCSIIVRLYRYIISCVTYVYNVYCACRLVNIRWHYSTDSLTC
jgi:hypothetical protein